MKNLMWFVVFIMFVPTVILDASPQSAQPVSRERISVKVEDGSGAPLADDLVIIQNLNDTVRDSHRVLTDANGEVPPFDLGPGLYRLIATFPHSDLWQTEVQEFLVVKGRPKQIVVKVDVMVTHGYGDVIPKPGPKIQMQVLKSDGQPASDASVLVRDKNVTLYLLRWYRTDAKGMATIELVGSPLDAPTVVVAVYGDILVTREVAKGTKSLLIHLPDQ